MRLAGAALLLVVAMGFAAAEPAKQSATKAAPAKQEAKSKAPKVDKKAEKKDKKPKITCTVAFEAKSSATRASVSVFRGDRTFAHGRSSKIRNGRLEVPLRGSLRPGRYKITVRVTDADGVTRTLVSSIRVR